MGNCCGFLTNQLKAKGDHMHIGGEVIGGEVIGGCAPDASWPGVRIPLRLAALILLPILLAAAQAHAEPGVDPHAAHIVFHFQDKEMDFVFGSLILGAAGNGGCEVGEAFTTAARIKDGDAASWQAEWLKTARMTEERGENSLKGGHAVSARRQFLRASYYHRAAMVSMLPSDPRLAGTAAKSRSLILRAGRLMEPPIERVEIPFAGGTMHGLFRKAAPGARPAKTLVMVGGAETFAEDLYFYIGPQAFERGWNFLTVDLPGQGLMPLEGKVFRPDMAGPIRALLDDALSRPDVDPKRVVLYGISSGGGFAPQAAMDEARVSALVMNNCVVDAEPGVAKMAVATATPEVAATWSSFKRQTNQGIAWRFGVGIDNLPGLVAANRGFTFTPARVKAPSLVLVSNGESRNEEIKRQTALCMEGLASPVKKLVVTPSEEGASNHCVMENRSLMSQEVFDWLEEVLK